MAKYIDADLLRKEIEKKSHEEQGFRSEDSEYGYRSCARDLLAFIDYLQQEQRETDEDDGKFVKILVRKEFAGLFQRLGDEIQAGQSSFVRAMNRQEQPEIDLETEIINYFQGLWPGIETPEQCNTDMHFTPSAIMRLARYFYELGINARK